MRLFVTISILTMVVLGVISFHSASANVWIPDNEFKAYYDVNGTYTVIGAVKNTEDKPIIPSVTFNVKDSNQEVSETYTLSIVDPGKDIPFKITLPQVESKNVILETPHVSFITVAHQALKIEVIYDKTLTKHVDGHTSGFIVNNDTNTAYGVKVYAVIYGKDGKFLDVGKSVETIDKMEPGDKIEFSMYPDPQYASKVSYYSCFALGEDPTQTVMVERNGNPFYFTYLSSGYMTDAKFDDFQQSISITARHPFPDKGYVNFMFPQESDSQKFSVTSDGKPAEVLQSRDPDGNWHVALTLPPQSTTHLIISGFEEHSLLPVGNFRNYLLIIIPIVAVVASVIIWKKKKG